MSPVQPPQPPGGPDPVDVDNADNADNAVEAIAAIEAIEIEDVIDLHGFQPRDIPSVVEEYIHAAHEKGYREVRLIHGRGKGFQRHRVREVLAGLACVERFADAPPGRGGWGATLVWLGAKD